MNKIKPYIFVHFTVFIGSFNGIFMKLASKEPFLSFQFCLFYGLVILGAGLYALLWQQCIKHLPLNIAYANKSVNLIWMTLWGVLIFKEHISVSNIIGTVVVLAGVLLMTAGGEKNE